MDSNFPFQFAMGSQTSMPICESEVGVSLPITRQKLGNPVTGPVRSPGFVGA